MCVVSAIGDNWQTTWPNKYPGVEPFINNPPAQTIINIPYDDGPLRRELEALKKEMQELKTLLIAAKKYDEATGQPDCEMDEKVELIKKVAKLVGVDMTEVFGK